MNYRTTTYSILINILFTYNLLYSMESPGSNNSLTKILETIISIDNHCTEVQNNLKNLRNFCETQSDNTAKNIIKDQLNEQIDRFHANIQKGNKFLDIKGTFTQELLATIKKNIFSPAANQHYQFIIDESIITLTNIRDMTLLKIIGFAQTRQYGTNNELLELIKKSKKLTTQHNTMHYLIFYTYCLNQYLPCIKQKQTKDYTLSALTLSRNHIDSLVQKKIADTYADYKEKNDHIIFIKKLSTMTLEQAILRTYFVHISKDNQKLYQSLKQSIKDIDDIRENLQENMSVLCNNRQVLQEESLSLKDLLNNIIILQQFLPSQPINNQKTDFYVSLIQLLSDYTNKLKTISIEKDFFDITNFTHLVTSYNQLKTVLKFDDDNQHIVQMIKIHEDTINLMLEICITTYKNISNDYELDVLTELIKTLFSSCNSDKNNLLNPYQTKIIDALTQYKQKITSPQTTTHSPLQIIEIPVEIPPITHITTAEPIVEQLQEITPIQENLPRQNEKLTINPQAPITTTNTQPEIQITEQPIQHIEQTQEMQSFLWPMVNIFLKPFQFMYALFTWLFPGRS